MADDHEFIIKMPDEKPVPEFGLGYEIFHKMQLRKDEISQFFPETDESQTFGELLEDSIKVAINLQKLNLAKDDIIAIAMWNNKFTCVPYIAGLFNGNIVTFLDPIVVPKEKALMLGKVTPKVLFVDEDNLDNIEESLRIAGLNIKIVVFGDNKRGHISYTEFLKASTKEMEAFQPAKLEDNDRTGIIIFSSGTTGVPKGICLSHLSILSRTSGFNFPSTMVFTTPNWISYSLILIRCLREGGARVLCKEYHMSQVWGLIHKYKVNLIISPVFKLCQLIEHPLDESTNISSLLMIMISGATLPFEIYSRIKKIIPNVIIHQAYGLTEICGVSMSFDLAQPQEREWQKKKPESCGTPIPGIWYKVVDPDTEEILGPNKQGELRLKSKMCMLGYYNDDSSKDFDKDGYLKTGDIVYYDEDKCFYVVERIKEMLKYQGNVVSPTAIEGIMTSHPSVEIAAVIGLPHIIDGDHPLGIVKLRPNCKADPEELLEYVNKNVYDEKHRLKAGVKIIEDLPVNGAGKIDKRKLRDDHKYIIKMPDHEDDVPGHGIGYEIFHKMQLRKGEIAQYVIETDESVTFGELLEDSTKAAINLKKLNLTNKDIVAICSWSHKQTCIPYIAGLLNANIVTFLDPLVIPEDKAHMLRKVTPSILFVDEDNLQSIEESLKLAELDIKVIVFGKNTNGHVSFDEFLKVSEEEVENFEPVKLESNEGTAAIFFTSGTTGLPKGICNSHIGLLSRTSGFAIPVTIILSAPNWISYVLLLLRSLREGGARVLGKDYDLSQMWALIHKYKINILLPSIYQLSQMMKAPIDEGIDISSLEVVCTSGASLPPEIQRRLQEMVPNVIILQAYGMTETSGPSIVFNLGTTEGREWHKNKPNSCGTPVPGFWYKVVDPDTEEILGPNKPGELRLKSKLSMLGYYNQDSSSDFDSDGYFKTGDIVEYDEDKCFYVIDRIKEMVKFRGFYWSPNELENVLITHPSVEIAAVVGVPHLEDGHVPMGLVKLRKNFEVSSEELLDYVDKIVKDERKKLRAGIKIVNSLPLTGSGKIHKKRLNDMVLAGEI